MRISSFFTVRHSSGSSPKAGCLCSSIYKEELKTVVRELLACTQPNRHETSTALWKPYRRVSLRGRRAQIRFSRARGEKTENAILVLRRKYTDFRARFEQCYCGSAIIGMPWCVFRFFLRSGYWSGNRTFIPVAIGPVTGPLFPWLLVRQLVTCKASANQIHAFTSCEYIRHV